MFSPLGRQDRPRQSNTKSCAAPQDGYQLAEASPLCGASNFRAFDSALDSRGSADSLPDSFWKNWFGAMWERNHHAKGRGEGVPSSDWLPLRGLPRLGEKVFPQRVRPYAA